VRSDHMSTFLDAWVAPVPQSYAVRAWQATLHRWVAERFRERGQPAGAPCRAGAGARRWRAGCAGARLSYAGADCTELSSEPFVALDRVHARPHLFPEALPDPTRR
jgi:hypothetical protein